MGLWFAFDNIVGLKVNSFILIQIRMKREHDYFYLDFLILYIYYLFNTHYMYLTHAFTSNK